MNSVGHQCEEGRRIWIQTTACPFPKQMLLDPLSSPALCFLLKTQCSFWHQHHGIYSVACSKPVLNAVTVMWTVTVMNCNVEHSEE